jgi:hypothetical protein
LQAIAPSRARRPAFSRICALGGRWHVACFYDVHHHHGAEQIMSYLRTESGRLFTAAVGISLTGGGIAALVGGPTAIPIMCLSLLLTVLVSLFAAGLGSKDSAATVILLVVLSPFALFSYVLGLGLAIEHAPQMGYAFGVLGALALARAVFIHDEKPSAAREGARVHAH